MSKIQPCRLYGDGTKCIAIKSHFPQLDSLVDDIAFETQRAVYAEDQRAILNAVSRFLEMMGLMEAVPCEEEEECIRDKSRIAEGFYQDFNVQGEDQEHIFLLNSIFVKAICYTMYF